MYKYAGAGVILLEYFKINNIYELCVIIIHNKYKKLYECPGGKVELKDNIYKTAVRELREETINLFKLPKHILTSNYSVDISSGRRFYKTFLLYLIAPINTNKKINLDFYFYNKNLITNNNIPLCWDETDNITRLSIKQFMKDIKICNDNDNLYTKNIYNIKIIFSNRDKQSLLKAINKEFIKWNNDIYISNVPIYQLHFNDQFKPLNNKFLFLKDTKYYY